MLLPALAPFSRATFAQPAGPAGARTWRSFEVTSRIEVIDAQDMTRVWLPLPSVDAPGWMRDEAASWSGNSDSIEVIREPRYGARILFAQWQTANPTPALEVINRFSACDRHTDLSNPSQLQPLEPELRALYTQATRLIPVDGIVRDTATTIVRGSRDDLAKARAIYEWVVQNTVRNPKTRGCGLGDIRFMLETGDLSGKCADLNALYVGLCRSVGIPARDVYGLRVGDSRQGYKSLGRSGDVSKAQHCRAEVWLAQYGWVPVDPQTCAKSCSKKRPVRHWTIRWSGKCAANCSAHGK